MSALLRPRLPLVGLLPIPHILGIHKVLKLCFTKKEVPTMVGRDKAHNVTEGEIQQGTPSRELVG